MPGSRRYRATVLAAAMAAVLCPPGAPAGIVVSPLKQDVAVKPGGKAKFYITVSNNARNQWEKAQSVHLEVMDFSVDERGGITFKPPGTASNSTGTWITLGKSDLTLAPGEGEKLECVIKAPSSAVGEYCSAVMVTLQTKGRTRAGLTVGYRIASGVFVTVTGQTFPKQAQIVRCEAAWPKGPAVEPIITEPEPVKVEPVKVLAVLKNTGRVRFEASGELRISDARGRIVYRAPMTTRRTRVLPGDTRLFEAVLDKALPQGQYRARVELDYQSKWAKARTRLPLTISADQAGLLARLASRARPAEGSRTSPPRIEVAPERLTARIPPGGCRWLKVVVTNAGKDVAQCTAAVAGNGSTPIPPSWTTVGSDTFALGKGRSKTLSLIVGVPSDAAGGYSGTLIVEATGTDGTTSRTEIPLTMTAGVEQ